MLEIKTITPTGETVILETLTRLEYVKLLNSVYKNLETSRDTEANNAKYTKDIYLNDYQAERLRVLLDDFYNNKVRFKKNKDNFYRIR